LASTISVGAFSGFFLRSGTVISGALESAGEIALAADGTALAAIHSTVEVVCSPGIAKSSLGGSNATNLATLGELATCDGHHAGFGGGWEKGHGRAR